MRSSGCLSDLALDAIVTGERSAAEPHLEVCEGCCERLALFRSIQERAAPHVARLVERAQKMPAPQSWRSRWLAPGRIALLAGAAACAALVWVATLHRSEVGEELRVKGASVKFYRMRGGVVAPGVSGDSFRSGDALRFLVTTGEPTWFFLIGIEENGKVSAYHPFAGKASVRMPSGVDQPLPGSLVLDEARGSEYFVALFSSQPLDFARIQAAAAQRRGEHLDLPAHQQWIVIRKEAR